MVQRTHVDVFQGAIGALTSALAVVFVWMPLIAKAQLSSPPPPAGGYSDIALLSPTAELPSVATCLARVRRSSWEPRPQNNAANQRIVPLLIPRLNVDSAAEDFYLSRIKAVNDARITGTTDELIQFLSCYWGLDDETTRARAVIESSWDQATNGDLHCNNQGVSWGLLQVKDEYPRGCRVGPHRGTYPDVFLSTANNLNYALALTAACYRGDMNHWIPNEFMNDPARRMRECIGLHYSGEWRQNTSRYLSDYDNAFASKPWLKADFPNWNVGNTCRPEGCYTLPSDPIANCLDLVTLPASSLPSAPTNLRVCENAGCATR